jgi:SPP1 family predicted phage head-tail adaptor
VKAGPLNRRVTIQRRIGGKDAAGQPIDSWADVATVWANVSGSTGMSTIKAGGDVDVALKRYSIRIRFRDGLDEGMRVVQGATVFEIQEVRMDYAGREWTDLVCRTLGVARISQTFGLLLSGGGYLLKSDGGKLLGTTGARSAIDDGKTFGLLLSGGGYLLNSSAGKLLGTT